MRSRGLQGHQIVNKNVKISKWVEIVAPGSFEVKLFSVVVEAVTAKNVWDIFLNLLIIFSGL